MVELTAFFFFKKNIFLSAYCRVFILVTHKWRMIALLPAGI